MLATLERASTNLTQNSVLQISEVNEDDKLETQLSRSAGFIATSLL